MTEEKKELITRDETALANPTPGQLLQIAISKDADIEKLEKLMDMQERWEDRQALKAYVRALAAFHANPPAVVKDKTNKQYGSMYVSIDNLVNGSSPALSKHGLSCRWDREGDDPKRIGIKCILTHEMGHSESVTMYAPPDESGSKNPIQQIKSTVTYLQIITFSLITGLTSSDANLDDDGGGPELISQDQAIDLEVKIQDVGGDLQMFLKGFGITSLEKLPLDQLSRAVHAIDTKRTS